LSILFIRRIPLARGDQWFDENQFASNPDRDEAAGPVSLMPKEMKRQTPVNGMWPVKI
jgi:hypothetical protein